MTVPGGSRSLAGVIDIHCHCGPDSLPRSVDAVDLARIARERGMRGIVLKNHFESTASMAYLAKKAVPEIHTFGGVTLNLAVGGMNAYAVEHMAQVTGKLGRFVWMGSFDTEAQVRYAKQERPFVAVQRSGKILPEVKRVLEVIARYSLVLETGHQSVEEVLMLIHEARSMGVSDIVVTHAMMSPVHMKSDAMCEAAASGAWIEFVYNGLMGPFKEFDFADYVRAIRVVGAERCVLASDLGQPANPAHPDGLESFFDGLEQQGITSAEIDVMSKTNPARILGLD